MKVKFERFSTRARWSQKPTEWFAGYDLFSTRNIVLEPHSTQCIENDIGLCFSKRFFAKIYSHCGLSSRSIESSAGVIDSDFRGNVKVVLHNLRLHRTAQIVFQKGECLTFA